MITGLMLLPERSFLLQSFNRDGHVDKAYEYGIFYNLLFQPEY